MSDLTTPYARGADLAPRASRSHVAARLFRHVPGPTLAATYLSLLVLLPIAAVLSKAFDGGFSAFWSEITDAETLSALRLSLVTSLIVVIINSVAGIAIAWQLVRDRFFLNRFIGALVDLPFALPTVIAGLTLITVYGPGSPIDENLAFTRPAIVVALAFVTLPFSVRAVQPVLAALDEETEQAAASLGAGNWTIFRRIILPSLMPALLTGAGLGFARAIGEYGSVVLVSGNIPFKTEMASVRIFGLIQSDNLPAAAAVAFVLFLTALIVLTIFGALKRHYLHEQADAR